MLHLHPTLRVLLGYVMRSLNKPHGCSRIFHVQEAVWRKSYLQITEEWHESMRVLLGYPKEGISGLEDAMFLLFSFADDGPSMDLTRPPRDLMPLLRMSGHLSLQPWMLLGILDLLQTLHPFPAWCLLSVCLLTTLWMFLCLLAQPWISVCPLAPPWTSLHLLAPC